MCWPLLYIKFSPLINFLTTCFLHSFCTLLCLHAPLCKNHTAFATLFFLQKNYRKGESEHETLSVMYNSLWSPGLYSLSNSPGQNSGMGVFPFSRGSSQPRDHPRSPALQEDSFPAEPQGKPENTGVASGSSRPRNRTSVSCTAGGLFTNWISGKPNDPHPQ